MGDLRYAVQMLQTVPRLGKIGRDGGPMGRATRVQHRLCESEWAGESAYPTSLPFSLSRRER
jgi:hypothetical protein